jgi:hypothetical protein
MKTMKLKTLKELEPLDGNATIEQIEEVLSNSKRVLAKRLAKALGKKDAKLFKEKANEAYILEFAEENIGRVIRTYNLILVFSNLGRNIANAGIDGVNKIIDIIAPFLIQTALDLVAEEVPKEEAGKISQEEVKLALSACFLLEETEETEEA